MTPVLAVWPGALSGPHTYTGFQLVIGKSRNAAEGSLLSDAEAPEDLAQQIVGSEFPGDRSQGQLSQPQFLGEQLEPRQLLARRFEVLASVGKRLQVPLASDEKILGGMPADDPQQFLAQQFNPFARACGQRNLDRAVVLTAFGGARYEIDLVMNGEADEMSGQLRENGALRIADAAAGINQQDDCVGTLDLAPGPFDADLLDFIVGFTQARGIDHVQWNSCKLQSAAHQVTSGSGKRRNDGQVVAGEAVEQARFADIRLAGEHDVQTSLQQSALPGTCKEPTKPLLQTFETAKGIRRFKKIDLLIRKIERCFDQCTQLDELLEQRIHLPGKFPLQRAYGAACCDGSGRVNQINDCLGLSEVELTVEERASGKFARLRDTRAKLQATSQQHLQDDLATVRVQLKHLLASEGAWRGKMEQQSAVDDTAVSAGEVGKDGGTGLRSLATQGCGEIEEALSGEPNYADRSATGSGRDGGDRLPDRFRPCCRWRPFRHSRSSG